MWSKHEKKPIPLGPSPPTLRNKTLKQVDPPLHEEVGALIATGCKEGVFEVSPIKPFFIHI